MRHVSLLVSSIALAATTGCASSLKLENVAGTWSCDRVDGVCADISAIDQATIGGRLETSPVGSLDARSLEFESQTSPVTNRIEVSMPSRTADEVARIVLAPSLDTNGRYHSSRVMFAVMKPGDWVPGSLPSQSQITVASAPDGLKQPTRLTPEFGDDQTASAVQYEGAENASITRTVTDNNVTRTITSVRRYPAQTSTMSVGLKDQIDTLLASNDEGGSDGE